MSNEKLSVPDGWRDDLQTVLGAIYQDVEDISAMPLELRVAVDRLRDLAAAPQPPAEQSPEHVPGLAGLIAAKTAEIEPLIPWQIRTAEQVEEYKDARRYRRLQILGAAPYGSQNLSKGTVLSFQALDAFVDSDLEAYPSRGESKAAQSPVAVLQDAPGLDELIAAIEAAYQGHKAINSQNGAYYLALARQARAAIAKAEGAL